MHLELCGSSDGVLRDIISGALPLLRAKLDEADRTLPGFVWREFERYLSCRDFAEGFAWLECRRCDVHRLVPWTCQGRGFCPCCTGRRMATRAAFWVDEVLPRVGVRQWVFTLPWRVRWLCARKPEIMRALVGLAWEAVSRFQQRRAARLGHIEARTGSITAIQRFGSALNLNLHAHALHLDGVYVEREGELQFVPLPPPTTEDVEELVVEIAGRCERWLERAGHGQEAAADEEDEELDGLSTVQARSVEGRAALGRVRRVQRLGGKIFKLPPRCASSQGYNLHAGVAIGARDGEGLERLARYISRGPVARGRLSRAPNGDVVLQLKRAWSDGTTEIRFTPLAFVERLASLVPSPRAHQVLYHGVLAPRAAWRSRVVPSKDEVDAPPGPPSCPTSTLSGATAGRSRWVPWAQLLWRVFQSDGMACPICSGPMRIRTLLCGPPATVKVWASLRRSAQRARPPPCTP